MLLNHKKKLNNCMSKVAIIGQGYVGLPLAVAAAQSGIQTVGIEINPKKVELLNLGISDVEDVTSSDLASVISKKLYRVTSDYSSIEGVDVVVICVPTPLTTSGEPDLSLIVEATKSFSKHLNKGVLIILESTVAPGTTREILIPLIEKESGLSETSFDVAYSPERIDPSNHNWSIKNTPKVVSGINLASLTRASEFYSRFVDSVIECESLEVAETAKLLENTFRLINISLINEISVFCNKLGISVTSVVSAASSKPYGFMPFFPSLGVGGHCIPVDPIYLENKASTIGAPIRMIKLASEINRSIPEHFVRRAEMLLKSLKDRKILVIGIAYKPNVSDTRESPAKALIVGLRDKGARVFWNDDLVKSWNGEFSTPINSDFDLAIMVTPHDDLDLSPLSGVKLLNTRDSI
jgi:UDP-N-acetyl-D-glucosamine dehydrogenase